jgi:hypothetical protein
LIQLKLPHVAFCFGFEFHHWMVEGKVTQFGVNLNFPLKVEKKFGFEWNFYLDLNLTHFPLTFSIFRFESFDSSRILPSFPSNPFIHHQHELLPLEIFLFRVVLVIFALP